MLDSSPLWLAVSAPGKQPADDCRAWLKALESALVRVVLPEIADYEVRRELLLRNATAAIRRLDVLKITLDFQPITSAAMLRAAEYWAALRRGGQPTAGPQELDGDAILAGQAWLVAELGDTVTIATSNAAHLTRFPNVNAQHWTTIS